MSKSERIFQILGRSFFGLGIVSFILIFVLGSNNEEYQDIFPTLVSFAVFTLAYFGSVIAFFMAKRTQLAKDNPMVRNAYAIQFLVSLFAFLLSIFR